MQLGKQEGLKFLLPLVKKKISKCVMIQLRLYSALFQHWASNIQLRVWTVITDTYVEWPRFEVCCCTCVFHPKDVTHNAIGNFQPALLVSLRSTHPNIFWYLETVLSFFRSYISIVYSHGSDELNWFLLNSLGHYENVIAVNIPLRKHFNRNIRVQFNMWGGCTNTFYSNTNELLISFSCSTQATCIVAP